MRLAQLHIPVIDIERAVAFYREVLGFEFLFQVPDQPMAFFQAGDVRLYLGVPESGETGGSPIAYYSVDNLDAECSRITALRIDIIHDPHVVHRDDRHELWMASLHDSEGNMVTFMEERPL